MHSLRDPLACSQWFGDILRTAAGANVNAFTRDYWVGLESGRLERVRVLKEKGTALSMDGHKG